MGTMARTAVVAGTATAVSGGMRRGAAQRDAQQQEAAAAQQQATVDQAAAQAAAQMQTQQAQPAAMSMDDRIAKIKALGELKDSGLLSEEEFATEKAKVLAA
jgi:hypothetical protein